MNKESFMKGYNKRTGCKISDCHMEIHDHRFATLYKDESLIHRRYDNKDTAKVDVMCNLCMDRGSVEISTAFIDSHNSFDTEYEEKGHMKHFSIPVKDLILSALAECSSDGEKEDPDHRKDDAGPECINRYSWDTRSPVYPDIFIEDDCLIALLDLQKTVNEIVEKYVPNDAVLISEEEANKENKNA